MHVKTPLVVDLTRSVHGALATVFLLVSCSSASTKQTPSDGGDASSANQNPAYEVVFPTNVVETLRLTISATDYAAMQADLASLVGSMPGGGGFPADAGPPPDGGFAFGDGGRPAIPDGGGPDGGGQPGQGGGAGLFTADPIYVPVDVEFHGSTVYHAGMRYKGNSSLSFLYGEGIRKLPFRIDFDQFRDRWPETTGQRFNGFQKLTFSPNYGDDSQIREGLALELLAQAGVPTARAAFYRVVIDVGNGDEYLGLYTVIEDPADGAMLSRLFHSQDGNLYKPDGQGADWTAFDTAGFTKKTNAKADDFSDVQQAITALHADRTDAGTWRRNLEALFDVGGFLRWLAVNTSLVNWDSYGTIAHNYYLYGVPAQAGKLVWIPWDYNESLRPARSGIGTPAGMSTQTAQEEFFHSMLSEAQWPLIRRLLDDTTYAALYRSEIQTFLSGPFAQDKVVARATAMHDLVAPHVVGAQGEVDGSRTTTAAAFEVAITGTDGLAAFVGTRHQRAQEALAAP